MRNRLCVITVLFLAIFYGSASAKLSFAPMKILAAKVDGVDISMSRYERAVSNAGADLMRSTLQISPEAGSREAGRQEINDRDLRTSVLNELIDQALIGKGARREGVNVTEEEVDREIAALKEKFPSSKEFHRSIAEQGMTIQDLKNNIREQLKTKALERILMSKMVIPDEEIAAFYDKNIELFVQPKKVSLRQILVRDRDLALSIAASLEAGGDFAELASAHSIDPDTKDKGGEMGFVERGKLPQELEDAAFKLVPGSISSPIESDDGFHVITVISRVPGKETSLLEAKEKIREFLLEERSADAFSRWLEDRRANSDIIINENLKYLFEEQQSRDSRNHYLGGDIT